ncbi:LPXTG-motif cell wall anchor domain-containing protein [Lentzea xinjiangensis]|uniref:LPXTG-motif cell wall anchor domain-containing protein n=1 Tax=Lentzea xinjiangensis TaxID=402600 RepID=A0A1H9UR58_9PSEU|nr:LPXTG cell wall anchor domain-containing protein [Lentzea xinjiangensis]SES11876.1 LPXTG-motif cell wall anchor domain-containing protein [Lentzea xinjiangensis]
MRLTPLRRSGLLGAMAAAVATLALATTASADEPTTDDPRAVAFAKNVDINHPDACTVGGLTGTTIHPNKFTYTGGDNQQHLDITGLPANVQVTGIVVKGGDAFNVYLAGKLGATLPWEDLRAPLNNGGKLPEISHWYGCGIPQTPSSSVTTTTTTTSTTTATITSSSTAATTPTSSSSSSSSSDVAPTTTTTTVAPVPVANEDDLASTGFGSAWLLGLGAALVAAGAAVLLVMRRRRA